MVSKKNNSDLQVTAAGLGDKVAVPVAFKAAENVTIPNTVLPAVGTWVSGDAINVSTYRWLHVFVTYTAGGASGELAILPEVHAGFRGDSNTLTDSWVPLPRIPSPSAPNVTALPSVPTGGASTGDNFDKVVVYPVVYSTAPSTGGDTITFSLPISVDSAKLVRVSVTELVKGGASVDGLVEVRYLRSI